ncbi:MAG TPA: phosphatidylserine/phosphatidylglycerophosphate/cardiolipin synthase family protein [Thermoanaerobaculia bacterium]|nr:phosphatidylserine/phosphatidylglycerophosphate/cardiolipin synthase family protein [Thermoanaerobaculia bacterium]
MKLATCLLAIILAMPLRADVFRVLDDPRDAAQARVDLIQQATKEIDALYFLARNDRITMMALALLRDARRRGVGSVRMIVDANFQHIPKAVLAHLSDEGVQVRVYHPLTLRHPSWLFRRMHEKVVVVDGERYITGGRNLAEAYFGLAKRNYVDRDVYVEGESAAEADRHFDELWHSNDVIALHVRVSDRKKAKAARVLDQAACELAGFIQYDTGRNWSEGKHDIADVEFVHDPLHEGPRLTARLNEIIGAAQSSVVIESPYLVPSAGLLELLRKKIHQGVRVQIVTSSWRSSDGLLAYVGYLKYRRRLIRAGIDVREYKGPDMLHAKSMVVDGRTVLVGSYNVDPRSENLNAEAMCIADDQTAAQELLASIDAHAQNAWIVGAREHRMGLSRAARLRAWALRILLPLYERQL